MTTAENGQRALEFLGLVDGQQHNHIGGVSKLLYCKSTKSQSLQSFSQNMLCNHYLLLWVQDSKVNLIITDYCMPGITGFDLLKKVKVIESLLSN